MLQGQYPKHGVLWLSLNHVTVLFQMMLLGHFLFGAQALSESHTVSSNPENKYSKNDIYNHKNVIFVDERHTQIDHMTNFLNLMGTLKLWYKDTTRGLLNSMLRSIDARHKIK